jgi:glycine cleavage system H protein
MEHILTTVGSLAVFVAGLGVRFGLVLLVIVAVAIPIFAVVTGIRGLGLLRRRALGVSRVDGLFWRRDLLAQRLLYGVRAVQLPRLGAEIHEGEVATVIACGPKEASIASPVDGVVTAVNEEVGRDPSLIRRDPYVKGWLFKVAPANSRFTRLPTGDSARTWLKEEAARLARFLERDLGVATADGGEFRAPPSALLGDEGWEALTRAFLGAGATASDNPSSG